MPTQFSGKTWIFAVQAAVFGSLGGFALLLGPLFLLGIAKPADGRPGTEGGIALTLVRLPMVVLFALAVFNLIARRRWNRSWRQFTAITGTWSGAHICQVGRGCRVHKQANTQLHATSPSTVA